MEETLSKVTVKQDAEEPVASEVIAQAIVDISEGMKSLNNSGLKRRAITALIHDQSGVPKRTIELVLNNLESLRQDWCTR
jgi:hypothetical protein